MNPGSEKHLNDPTVFEHMVRIVLVTAAEIFSTLIDVTMTVIENKYGA